jgi:uncharacterized membrane protein
VSGIFAFKMAPWQAFLYAVIGNVLPLVPLFFGLERARTLFYKIWTRAGRALDLYIERAKQKVHGQYELYGMLGLFAFTALPFPLTGVYTATVAAIFLRLPLWKSFFSILAGIVATGFLVLAISMGIIQVPAWLAP